MVPLIAFCGASGSGKTTLLEKVLAELSARGLAVGALKHHGHGGAVVEPAVLAGKDSARLAASGARRVMLRHPGGLSISADASHAALDLPALASRFFYDLDLALAEGFKTAAVDKIEVVAPGAQPLLPPGGQLLALARRGGAGREGDLPVLDADDAVAVADFCLAAIRRRQRPGPSTVRARVGGAELGLNAFSQRVIAGALRGLLAGFKGGDAPGPIEVIID